MSGKEIRILGLTLQPVANFRAQPNAKSTGLYAALDRRFTTVGIVQPELPTIADFVNKLSNLHYDRFLWRSRVDLNPEAFKRRSQVAEENLAKWEGKYDLIVQLHTLSAPSLSPGRHLYTLHTDNTYMLAERHYPKWAPLRGVRRDEWVNLERQTYQGAAFLFPRSEFLRRSMIEDYGCDPDRVIRVGGGSNLSLGSLEGRRYDRQIALFVGGDFERKGGHILLEAWRSVHRRLPDAELWIVGPRWPPTYRQPGVRWFGKVRDRAKLADMYTRATVFVLPSLFEPWGHVFLEAMGHGLPCIATNHCAMPEIIEDGATGLLVPPGDPDSLAQQLSELLGDPDRATALGHRAHQSVLHGHTWDDVVARMAPYIEQAVLHGVTNHETVLG